MLHRQHAGRQAFGCVTGQDRHPRLSKDRTVIQVGGHLVNRAACFLVARRDGAGVGIKPPVPGQ